MPQSGNAPQQAQNQPSYQPLPKTTTVPGAVQFSQLNPTPKQPESLLTDIVKDTVITVKNIKDGQVWRVSLRDGVIIGRDSDCIISVADKSVSRRQCRIYGEGEIMVQNLSRSNVTVHNGKPLEGVERLYAGDTLVCGLTTFKIEEINTAAGAAATGQPDGEIPTSFMR